ncbi:MAG TPA: ParB/RepB/Spo0J family partition protein [Anaerolineaceae bacterium]|mgnify:FL=1|nr:ParB/RepB/Spo0J family partition protein [Anaerolineaceae bacterium]
MAQRSGLGKGLESLIPTWQSSPAAPGATEQVRLLPINSINPNPQQPRTIFEEEQLDDLAASIKQHGIIQPLIVIAAEGVDRYTLIAGERRLRAAKLAGLKDVPAIVRSASQQEQLEFAIIENVQREDLNPMERARAYQSLADQFSLTHEDVAHRVGKSRVTVTNTLRLLNLPAVVQQSLQSGEISEGHARSLLALPTARAMEAALDSILSLGLNVRQTELLVSKLSGKAPTSRKLAVRSAEADDLENRLRQFFHTKVNLSKGKRGGTISISYYSDEELNAILDKLGIND